MPSKILKRGIWRYRASVTVNGTAKQKLFPDVTKKSYREAVIWEKENKETLEKELSEIAMEYLAVSDWTEEYLSDVQDRFSTKTYKEKRSAFIRFSQEEGVEPHLPVESVIKSICQKFLKKQFRARSGYAANKDRKNLGAAWAWGSDNLEGWPKGENLFLAIKKFPEERSPRYVPPEEDFWKVYHMAKGQDQVMLLAFLNLAARRGEMFGLTWEDVDFSSNRVCLWTRKRESGNKESDWLPMTSELRKALLGWWQERMSQPTVDKKHAFVCLDKTPFCEKYYGRPFKSRHKFMKKICEKADVKPFGFHAIRHLTASILYRKGYSLGHIQAVLRHKNPNTTSRYLRSLGLEQVREALEEGLKKPADVIRFNQKTLGTENSEG